MGNPIHAGLPDAGDTDAGQRLYFLDWIRIGAFCVLVFFHTGLYYGPWEWHVKSPHAGAAMEPLLLLTSPWRMSLLFLVSGAASGLLLGKATGTAFLRERSTRLLVPLAFGMLAIVPPQAYCEVAGKMGYQGSYGEFLQRYLSGDPGFCAGGHCLVLPAWNHLWFVAYLWAYTLVLWLIVAIAGQRRLAGAGDWLAGLLTGWRAVLLPVAVLAVARALLSPRFATTYALVDDWYNHAVYFPIFLAGVLLVRQQRFWAELARLRFHALALALGAWALLVCLHAVPAYEQPGHQVALATAGVRSTLQWCAILAVCGFAYRHLNVDTGARRYLTEAVFCAYIVHQTLIVVVATAMQALHIAPFTEAVVIVVLTFAGSLAIFEAVKSLPALRPLFGIGPAGMARVAAASGLEPRPDSPAAN